MPTLFSVGQFNLRHLTRREVEIMDRLVMGMTNPEIGKALGIKPKTIENHITRIMTKVGMGGTGRRVLLALWYEKETR